MKIQLTYNNIVHVKSNMIKHVYEQTIVSAEVLEDFYTQLNKMLHISLQSEVRQG